MMTARTLCVDTAEKCYWVIWNGLASWDMYLWRRLVFCGKSGIFCYADEVQTKKRQKQKEY